MLPSRRATLAAGSEEKSQYQQRARTASARYRLKNGGHLASRQTDRRALKYIKEHGVQAWLDRTQPPPARRKIAEDDPGAGNETGDSATTSSSEDEGRGAGSSTPQRLKEKVVQEERVVQMSYEEGMNHFLDHCDLTTASDYVPLPGQTRFFQRGKWRWY
ncbi:hypothetical protein R3P38DRAFT_3206518 [Favolaschia claudopus]|uniref:Uncharacterized protein n=1 Tax=Favolaschia claudopus TaxID=2862362 RepID=A0AAW0ALL2_9AGAR